VPAASQLTLLPLDETPGRADPVIRIVVPCSKRKVYSFRSASRDELDNERARTERRLSAWAMPAVETYTGRAFKRSAKAVDHFAGHRPDLPIALHIASAGYGLVSASDVLVPYEATMGTSRKSWIERGEALGMPGAARLLVESCDLTLFALSEPYFHGLSIADLAPDRGSAIIIGKTGVVASENRRSIHAGESQARAFRTSEREVGAVVLERLLTLIAANGPNVVGSLADDPVQWPSE
jgi:hypothetical protein